MTLMFKIIFWLSRRIPGFGRLMWVIYSCEIPRRTKIGGDYLPPQCKGRNYSSRRSYWRKLFVSA